MDSEKERLLTCFNRLQQRLYLIKNNQINPEHELLDQYRYEHSIQDIVTGIFSIDFENALEALRYYKDQIEQILSDLSNLLNNYTYNASSNGVFEGNFKPNTSLEVKQQFEDTIKTELNYYLTQIETIYDQVSDKAMQLGNSRFANAGLKLKLNLTVEEVAYFFNLLYESGFIVKETLAGTKELTKKELASFISKNFNSVNADNISEKYITNNLSARNKVAEIKILDWVDKFSAIIDSTDKK